MKGHVEISLYDSNGRLVDRQSGDNVITGNHVLYIDKLYMKSHAIPNLANAGASLNDMIAPFPLISNGLGILNLFGNSIEDDEYLVYKSYLASAGTNSNLEPLSEEQIKEWLDDPNNPDGVLTDVSRTSSRITRTWKFGKGVYGDIASISLMKSAPYRIRNSYNTPYLSYPTNLTQLVYFDPISLTGYGVIRSSSSISVVKMQFVSSGSSTPRFIQSTVGTTILGSISIQNANQYGKFMIGMRDSGDVAFWACKRIDDSTVGVLLISILNDGVSYTYEEMELDVSANAYPVYLNDNKPFIHNGYLHYRSKVNQSDEYFNVACFSKIAYNPSNITPLTVDEDLYDNRIGNITYMHPTQIQFDGCVEYEVYDENNNYTTVSYEPFPVVNGEIKKHVRRGFSSISDFTPCMRLVAPLGGHVTYEEFCYIAYGGKLCLLDNYLGSKYNLETPIHKGQNQTLAIAYTLNF